LSVHPTTTELEAFAQGNLPPQLFRKIARHLFRGCAPCNALLLPHYQHLLPSPSSPEHQAYDSRISDELVDRLFSAFRSYRRYLRREEARQHRIATLLEAGGGLKVLLEKPEIPLRGLGTLRALLERSWAIRHENPQEMLELARYAVDVARNLNPRWHEEREIANWQAHAWGEYGNALRAREDLDEAERAFGHAFSFLLQGTGDLRLKAKLYDLHASYLGSRRRFDLAFTALDIVHSTYLEIKESHLAGRALIIKAMYTFYDNRPEDAIEINNAGMALIEKKREPNLLFAAIHNQLAFRVACGQFREARNELFGFLGEFKNLGSINQIKIRWLQAQIDAGLRKWQSAEQGFLHAISGFEKEGLGFHAAFASLELALVWMRQGRYAETQELIPQVYEAFVSLGIKEAYGAMLVLKEAFEKEMGSVELLKDVLEFLRRWYFNPDERFLPRGE
jgi:tetratricopeptide (TPR) repeat protein